MFPPWAPFFLDSRQAPLGRRRERGLGDGDDLTASATAGKILRVLRLGILVVVLVVATVVMVAIRNEVVRPALRRRRLAQLEEENRRLDELIKARDNQEAPR